MNMFLVIFCRCVLFVKGKLLINRVYLSFDYFKIFIMVLNDIYFLWYFYWVFVICCNLWYIIELGFNVEIWFVSNV